jgi:hypothetical protein
MVQLTVPTSPTTRKPCPIIARHVYIVAMLIDVSDHILQDNSIDVIPIAFVNTFFSTGGLPLLNLANVGCDPQQEVIRRLTRQ